MPIQNATFDLARGIRGAKHMPRAKTVTMEQVEAAKTLLRALPAKKREKTREEAAALLSKDFQTAFKKGYTIKELAEILKKKG